MNLVRRDAAQFKTVARRDRTLLKSSPTLLVKTHTAPLEQVAEREVLFTITSGSIDRENDVVALDGWDIKQYMANPVVLWGHDGRSITSLVGRCVEIGADGTAMKGRVEFAPADLGAGVGDTAETILRMCRLGFINATSVGFRPLEWEFTEDKARGADDWFPGIDFKKQELMEFSIVSIPCNPEALIDPNERTGDAGSAQQQPDVEVTAAASSEAIALKAQAVAKRMRLMCELRARYIQLP